MSLDSPQTYRGRDEETGVRKEEREGGGVGQEGREIGERGGREEEKRGKEGKKGRGMFQLSF